MAVFSPLTHAANHGPAASARCYLALVTFVPDLHTGQHVLWFDAGAFAKHFACTNGWPGRVAGAFDVVDDDLISIGSKTAKSSIF
jgi:hypothetical protein